MSKGWNVKVEADVVFTVDTNVGVVASTEEAADREAQILLGQWLARDDYKAELEKTLPWHLEMGGEMWTRGSWSADIHPQNMRTVFVEPDPDFDPDPEPLSECCDAPLLLYCDGLGICDDCREWSGPHREEDPVVVKQDAVEVRDLMEAAQCLNEAYQCLPDVHPLKRWQWENGVAEVRDQINLCAIYCDQLHRYMMENHDYELPFDFEFCPQFLENCVDHQTFKPKAESMQILFLCFNGATKKEYWR